MRYFYGLGVYNTIICEAKGSATASSSSLYLAPQSTTLSGSGNYYFSYFKAPITTVSTFTGTATTLYIEGAPTVLTGGTGYAMQILAGITRLLDTTNATSTTSGALVVAGGIGISGNLWVGGTINGTINGNINTSSVEITSNGTATNPSIYWTSTTNTGIYTSAVNTINFATGGANRLQISNAATNISTRLFTTGGTAATPGVTNSGSEGIWYPGSNQWAVSTNAVERLRISTTLITTTLPVFVPLGSAASPALQVGDVDSGIFASAVNNVNISTGGVSRLQVSQTEAAFALPIQVPNGSVSAPSITFSSDTASGIYLAATSNLGFSVAGTQALLIDGDTTNITEITLGRTTNSILAGNLGHGNYLRFAGTSGDTGIDAPFIANRIYTDATERSELLLWNCSEASNPNGPDRIRLRSSQIIFQCNSAAETVTIPTVADNNPVLSISAASPISLTPLSYSGAPVTTGVLYSAAGSTFTDNTTASSGTNSTLTTFFRIAAPTLAATNTTVTTTNAANLYIEGAPVAGTNQTITNPFALYVNAGTSFFGGIISLAGPTYRANQSLSTNTTLSTTTGGSLVVTTSAITITLPTPSNGLEYYIINTAAGTTIINTGTPATQYFNGDAASVSVSLEQFEHIHLVAFGTNWYTF